jgi:hypothetical protein
MSLFNLKAFQSMFEFFSKRRQEKVVSIPMRAVWEGMTTLPWEGPPPVDTKGFLCVMFGATTDPCLDPAVRKRFADKNLYHQTLEVPFCFLLKQENGNAKLLVCA